MIRDLHPHTRPQRAASAEDVPEAIRRHGYDPRDVPAASVAKWLGAFFLLFGASLGLVALLLLVVAPANRPVQPGTAAARFRSPAPPLAVDQGAERLRIERSARARLLGDTPVEARIDEEDSGEVAIGRAMRATAERGWQNAGPAPSPAEVARERAR